MSTNQTCTRYTIWLWAKRMNNYKRRRHRKPLYRRSRLTETQWVTWWSWRIYASQINPNNTQSAHRSFVQGVCIALCSMPARTPPTTWLGSTMPKGSTKPVTEAWSPRAYKSMGWRFASHYTILDFIFYKKTRRKRQKRQERKCYARSYTWKFSDKVRFADLKNRIKNDYVLNKVEYPRMVTAVTSLL